MSEEPKKQRKPSRPIHFKIVPATLGSGQKRLVLVPNDDIAREDMKERFANGQVVRAELTKARNIELHGLAHIVGQIVSENCDDFHGLDWHDAFKVLQLETRVECEQCEIDLRELGVDLSSFGVPRDVPLIVKQWRANSIAFDKMDDSRFRVLFKAVCRLVSEKYIVDQDSDAFEKMVKIEFGKRCRL
ncbi:MAG: hypothetical protein IPL86_16015 [Flavobacteriales bacterium]|nr:hypothetical protein [Flavobacteriales bacterium]